MAQQRFFPTYDAAATLAQPKMAIRGVVIVNTSSRNLIATADDGSRYFAPAHVIATWAVSPTSSLLIAFDLPVVDADRPADPPYVLVTDESTQNSTAQLAQLAGAKDVATTLFTNVFDFGAKGDGVTDDTVAIHNAVAAAQVKGGVVFFPAGVYPLSDRVNVPNGVNLLGVGGSKVGPATLFRATVLGAGISFGVLDVASEGGISSGWKIDGNGLSANPLYIGLCVDRKFFDICVVNAAAGGSGVLIQQAQNCMFVSLVVEDCAGNGLTLDRGCGGNVFLRTELNNNGDYSLRFTQSTHANEVGGGGGLFGTPSYNLFVGGDFEGLHGQVLHEAGLFNTLRDIAITDNPSVNQAMVKMTNPWALSSTDLELAACQLQGNVTHSTGISCDANTGVILGDRLFLQSLLNGVELLLSCGQPRGMLDPTFLQAVTNVFSGAFASFFTTSETVGFLRAQQGIGTQHVGAAVPAFGSSGDIKVGNGKLWANDNGTWKSVGIV